MDGAGEAKEDSGGGAAGPAAETEEHEGAGDADADAAGVGALSLGGAQCAAPPNGLIARLGVGCPAMLRPTLLNLGWTIHDSALHGPDEWNLWWKCSRFR